MPGRHEESGVLGRTALEHSTGRAGWGYHSQENVTAYDREARPRKRVSSLGRAYEANSFTPADPTLASLRSSGRQVPPFGSQQTFQGQLTHLSISLGFVLRSAPDLTSSEGQEEELGQSLLHHPA